MQTISVVDRFVVHLVESNNQLLDAKRVGQNGVKINKNLSMSTSTNVYSCDDKRKTQVNKCMSLKIYLLDKKPLTYGFRKLKGIGHVKMIKLTIYDGR